MRCKLSRSRRSETVSSEAEGKLGSKTPLISSSIRSVPECDSLSIGPTSPRFLSVNPSRMRRRAFCQPAVIFFPNCVVRPAKSMYSHRSRSVPLDYDNSSDMLNRVQDYRSPSLWLGRTTVVDVGLTMTWSSGALSRRKDGF